MKYTAQFALTRIFPLILTLASAAQAAPPANRLTADGIHYTTKRGDTLYGVATRYFEHVHDYVALQKQSRVGIPQHLQPGTDLVLPRALLKTAPLDAQIIAFHGNVAVNNAAPSIGMNVHEGATIATAANSFVTFALSNGSKITLPSNSAVQLTRLRKIVLDNSLDYDVSLLDGRAQTKATHFTDPNSRFQFKTHLATSAVRGTEFRIAFAKGSSADSLTEVLEGRVAVGTPKATTPQLIPEHMGAGVSASGTTHTEALLPAPDVSNINDLQKDDLVHFVLKPVAGAARYHVQIAHDAGFTDVFDDVRSATPEASFNAVPNGNLFVRTTAISATGFEGLANTSSFMRRLNSIHAIVEKGGHGGFHFKWASTGTGKKYFRFQLLTQKEGGRAVIDEPSMASTEIELTHLRAGTYYWRVGATLFDQGETSQSWTDPEKLMISGAGE